MPYQVLPTIQGGTGLSSYTTGDVLYASATNVLSKLAAGSDGDVLTLASGIPSWSAGGGGGGIGGSTGATDKAILIANGTGGSTLQAATSFTINGDQMLAPDGLTNAPSYSFLTSPTDGLYNQGFGDVAMTVGGVDGMVWTAYDIQSYVPNHFFSSCSLNNNGLTTGNYTVTANNCVLFCSNTAPSIITLDNSVLLANCTVLYIKDVSGNAATFPITITPINGATIDGGASAIINTNYGSLLIMNDGNLNYWIMGKN